MVRVSNDFGKLDISINPDVIINKYISKLKHAVSWKQIFSDFKIEFENSRRFRATIDNQKISLKDAILNDDGSVELNNKKVFSLR